MTMMKTGNRNLDEVTGAALRSGYLDLVKETCGCCSWYYDGDRDDNYYVCMGWHDTGDLPRGQWEIAVKIGRQPRRAMMTSDFDVDFEMPYDENGEIDDTFQSVAAEAVADDPCGRPAGYASWDELAEWLRKEALRVFNIYRKEDEDNEDQG